MKHYVRVCRPRFEVVVLEIETEDFTDAERSAPAMAGELPDEKWTLLPFDAESYYPHVERCARENELLIGCDTPAEKEEAVREMLAPETDHSARYLLLKGITDDGEGEVIGQPWFHGDDPELLEVDLANDWIAALEGVAEKDWLEYDRWSGLDAVDNRAQFSGEVVRSLLLERLLKARRGHKPGGKGEQ